MDIYLLRPSLTENVSPAVADTQAFLSLGGRQLVRAIGNKLRLTCEPSIDRVITTATPAAVQTAELFADRLDYVGIIEVFPSLAAGIPPQIAASLVLTHGSSVVIVADEPALSTLGAFFAGRPTFPLLQHAQVSVISDRKPTWYMRADTLCRSPLLVA